MEEKEFDYINMIPFIDVMLVLLTIVLTTSTFVAGGIIPVQLPRVVGQYERAMKTNLIEIDEGGRLYYQGKPATMADLKSFLRDVSREVPFLVRADRNLPLQSFVDVLDLVKGMGFKKISLQTEEMRK
jgi:biopolymer transport protein ExbD